MQEVTIVVQQECGYIAQTKTGQYVGLLGEWPGAQEGDVITIFLPNSLRPHNTQQEAQTAFCEAITAAEKFGVFPLTVTTSD